MLHERIKSATSVDHKNTESQSYGREIMSRTLTKAQYTDILIANYMYVSGWEEQWGKLPFELPATLNMTGRKKTQLLKNDLHKLGINPNEIQVLSIDLPKDYAQFMGRMYVIEGSTLGGAVIQKQLALNENLNGLSFDFYGGYGPGLIPNWKTFLGELNQITEAAQEDEAISAAKACFKDMEVCFRNAKTQPMNS